MGQSGLTRLCSRVAVADCKRFAHSAEAKPAAGDGKGRLAVALGGDGGGDAVGDCGAVQTVQIKSQDL